MESGLHAEAKRLQSAHTVKRLVLIDRTQRSDYLSERWPSSCSRLASSDEGPEQWRRHACYQRCQLPLAVCPCSCSSCWASRRYRECLDAAGKIDPLGTHPRHCCVSDHDHASGRTGTATAGRRYPGHHDVHRGHDHPDRFPGETCPPRHHRHCLDVHLFVRHEEVCFHGLCRDHDRHGPHQPRPSRSFQSHNIHADRDSGDADFSGLRGAHRHQQ
mmetsp:Transcript_9547/g.13020  ORF Transcript_9547/g.13020 Transcript_9547/m.13020 type:complete len:216 (-) Transcript_9547:1912-2559(-)